MYKTVSFNIFEENLQDVVYNNKNISDSQTDKREINKKTVEIRNKTEIILLPIASNPLKHKKEFKSASNIYKTKF